MPDTTASAPTAIDPESNEFATVPVPADSQVGWVRVAVVSAMVAFSLPTFVTGAEVFLALDNRSAFSATLLGCAILTIVAALCGTIGARAHLSSYMLARIAFGTWGATLVNIAFAVSLLGWFGVNIDLFSGAVIRLLTDAFAIGTPSWLVELGAGVIMTVTTIYGFRAINTLSMVLVPVMMVVTVILLSEALGVRTLDATLETSQLSSMSFGDAVSSVVGGVIIGAIIMPDITRFIRDWRGALYTALASYAVVQSLVMLSGGLAADVLRNDDFLDVLIVMGLSWGAFVIVIAGSWVLNSLNLYSAGLGTEATFPALRQRLVIIALGALGTAAAFLNILDRFLTFLFYLSVVFIPVAGIIAVDHFLIRPSAYRGQAIDRLDRYSVSALTAWLSGSAFALASDSLSFAMTGIAALDAILIAAILYAALGRWRQQPRNLAGSER
ncbi:MAG: cytosine permease [Pseudomonadota bacterium]